MELRRMDVLPAPFVLVPKEIDESATTSLYQILQKIGDRPTVDSITLLEDFLLKHPDSSYELWVRGSLGKLAYQRGLYTKAYSNWSIVWKAGRELFSDDKRNQARITEIGVELAALCARLGRFNELQGLLKELDERPIVGWSVETLIRVRQAYSMMTLRPERSFNCGSFALANVGREIGMSIENQERLHQHSADEDGFNLVELEQFAEEAGLDYRAAHRAPGTPLVLPCVVHWKMEHYAALLEQREGMVRVVDPTFKSDFWMKESDLFEEASGYFMVPTNALDRGWKVLTEEEKISIHGQGVPEFQDDDDDPCPSDCDTETGMPSYAVDRFQAAAVLTDVPLRLETPFGPGMEVRLTHFHASKHDRGESFSTVGNSWTLNLAGSYVETESVQPPGGGSFQQKLRLYGIDGRRETHQLSSLGSPNYHRLSSSTLTLVNGDYERRSPGGEKLIYGLVSGTRHHLTRVIDAHGTEITIHYDTPTFGGLRVSQVTDSFGRKLRFEYDRPEPGFEYHVTRIIEEIEMQDYREVRFGYLTSQGVLSDQLQEITDAAGIVTRFNYDPIKLAQVSSMTTPYGTTTFSRNSFDRVVNNFTYTFTHLEIQDPVGLKEHYLYAPVVDNNVFPAADLTLPQYGDGGFLGDLRFEEDPYWFETRELANIRYHYRHEGLTLHWDKKANRTYPPVFQDDPGTPENEAGIGFEGATVDTWMVANDGYGFRSYPVADSRRTPLTNTVLNCYDNGYSSAASLPYDMKPQGVMRVVENENGIDAVEEYSYTYDERGFAETVTDPTGRIVRFVLDPVHPRVNEIRRGTYNSASSTPYATPFLQRRYLYGDQRHPTLPTQVVLASGGVYQFAYNKFGQVVSMITPSNETFNYTYIWPQGYIAPTGSSSENAGFHSETHLSSPNSAHHLNQTLIISINYHSFTGFPSLRNDFVAGVSNGYEFDELGRIVEQIHSDGTREEFGYVRREGGVDVMILDPVTWRNRDGKITRYEYNGNRQRISIVDPEQRNTRVKWCSCGSVAEVIDPRGRSTKWKRDLLGRAEWKELPDKTRTLFDYFPGSGRLKSITFPEESGAGPSVAYSYYVDGAKRSTVYPGTGNGTQPDQYYLTEYDSLLPEVSGHTWLGPGGTVESITRSYHPLPQIGVGATIPIVPGAGELVAINGPWANDTLRFSYDQQNRVLGRRLTNDQADTNTTWSDVIGAIDSLDRIHHFTNGLGTFSQTFNGNSENVAEMTGPNGFSLEQGFYPLGQGGRLQSIKYLAGSNELERHEYSYDAAGRIRTWGMSLNQGPMKTGIFTYDFAGQLRLVQRQINGVNQSELAHAFGYDRVGNRISDMVGGTIYQATFDRNNQLRKGDVSSGNIPVIGHIDEYATVKLTAHGETFPARVRSIGNNEYLFEGEVRVDSDRPTAVSLQATDMNNNTTTMQFEVHPGASDWARFEYDKNGNLISLTDNRSVAGALTLFEWDRENRLVAVVHGGVRTEYSYDGSGDRYLVTISSSSGPTETRRLIWNDLSLVQERNETNGILVNYYDEGEVKQPQSSPIKRFYLKDHLGSIRGLVDTAGVIVSRYDYSEFGARSTLVGSAEETRLGYTGLLSDHSAGLVFARHRVYLPTFGRWLSSDPLELVTDTLAELLPEGTNLYLYLGNDPLNYLDPLGLRGGGGPQTGDPSGTGSGSTGGTKPEPPPKKGKEPKKPQDDLIPIIVACNIHWDVKVKDNCKITFGANQKGGFFGISIGWSW